MYSTGCSMYRVRFYLYHCFNKSTDYDLPFDPLRNLHSSKTLVMYQSNSPLHIHPPLNVHTSQLLFPSQIHRFLASLISHLHGQGPVPGSTCSTTLLA